MKYLHGGWLPALASAIVHDSYAGLNRVHQHGGIRTGLPVMGDDKQIDSSYGIAWAHELKFGVPGQVAKMKYTKIAKLN